MRLSRHHYSYQEYLYFEHYVSRDVKHEYINGDIVAMTGGSPEHAAVIANVIGALTAQLRGKPCRLYSSELKIRIPAPNVSAYPDASVVCTRAELDPEDAKQYSILNPIVIVEVLSPSTAEYDCGEKLEYYKMIPSLREVVLVDHEQRRIAVWRRGMGNVWRAEEISSGAIALESIDCSLSIDDVYFDPLAPS